MSDGYLLMELLLALEIVSVQVICQSQRQSEVPQMKALTSRATWVVGSL
jgi:hypothetical protein